MVTRLFPSMAAAGFTGAMRGFMESKEFKRKLDWDKFRMGQAAEELRMEKQAAADKALKGGKPKDEQAWITERWKKNVMTPLEEEANRHVLGLTGINVKQLLTAGIEGKIDPTKSPGWLGAQQAYSKYINKNIWKYTASFDRSMLQRHDAEGGPIDIFERMPEILQGYSKTLDKKNYWRFKDPAAYGNYKKFIDDPFTQGINKTDPYAGFPSTFEGYLKDMYSFSTSAATQDDALKKINAVIAAEEQGIMGKYGKTAAQVRQSAIESAWYQGLPPKKTVTQRMGSFFGMIFGNSTGPGNWEGYTETVKTHFNNRTPTKDEMINYIRSHQNNEMMDTYGIKTPADKKVAMRNMLLSYGYDDYTEEERQIFQIPDASADMTAFEGITAGAPKGPKGEPAPGQTPKGPKGEPVPGGAAGAPAQGEEGQDWEWYQDPPSVPPKKKKYPEWVMLTKEQIEKRKLEIQKYKTGEQVNNGS